MMNHQTSPSSQLRLADGILVINLDHRPERLERFRCLANEQPWLTGWQRLPAVAGSKLPGFGCPPWFHSGNRDNAWAGRAGCVLSHRNAIETALSAGWDRVCILEDDLDIREHSLQIMEKAASWLADHENLWRVAYLGFTEPVGPCQKLANLSSQHSICRISGCATTHAYVVKRDAMQWILNQLPNESSIWSWLAKHRAIDRWYARHLALEFPVVAVNPSIIGQISDFSDIGQRGAGDDRVGAFYDPIPSKHFPGSQSAYTVKCWLREVKVAFLDAYDHVRAWRKHANGF